jgi:hypothetical protein
MSNHSIEPGSLHGDRGQEASAVDTDGDILREVARMTPAEFKKKYISSPDAAANMKAYIEAVERRKQ